MIIGHTVYLTAQGRSEIEAPTRTYPVVQFIHLKSRSVVFYREGNFDIALPDYVQGYLDACKTIGEIDGWSMNLMISAVAGGITVGEKVPDWE